MTLHLIQQKCYLLQSTNFVQTRKRMQGTASSSGDWFFDAYHHPSIHVSADHKNNVRSLGSQRPCCDNSPVAPGVAAVAANHPSVVVFTLAYGTQPLRFLVVHLVARVDEKRIEHYYTRCHNCIGLFDISTPAGKNIYIVGFLQHGFNIYCRFRRLCFISVIKWYRKNSSSVQYPHINQLTGRMSD